MPPAERTEPASASAAEPARAAEPSEAVTSRSGKRKAEVEARRRRTTRTRRTAVGAAAAVLALAALFLVPGVRTVLRQSFTHLPEQSTAIYFTENPKILGTVLQVPITIRGVNTGVHTYGVKVWTENAAGRVDGSTTASIGTAHGVTAGVVSLPIADDAAEVWVSLDGTTQVLHFRITND